jgi:chemotaxis response regulator CheB/chemotaxis methyl-accepting protein methylase
MSLTQEEKELLYNLTEKITGTCQTGSARREVITSNILKRMIELGFGSLSEYLEVVDARDDEWNRFLSAITIHTTFWFREQPHFNYLGELLEVFHKKKSGRKFRFWSAACSTGEELFSVGLCLESFRRAHPGFNYEMIGTDIDPLSVAQAKKAIYPKRSMRNIPANFHHLLLFGSGATDGLFAIHKDIRSRTKVFTLNLDGSFELLEGQDFDVIFCRNVFIYFTQEKMMGIAQKLSRKLYESGILCLGHCEALNLDSIRLVQKYVGWHAKKSTVLGQLDSAAVQKEIPRVPPVSEARVETKLGGQPSFQTVKSLEEQVAFRVEKLGKVDLILIGASTGGPETIWSLLRNIKKPCPPILIVQHITPEFAAGFANRVASVSGLTLGECIENTVLKENHVYLSVGDYHIGVGQSGANLLLQHLKSNPLWGHRPSVDVLFQSVARLRRRCVAVLLTGMGSDGAHGILELNRTGKCVTFAQDEESSVVYGMPMEAMRLGAIDFQGNIQELRACLDITCSLLAARKSVA